MIKVKLANEPTSFDSNVRKRGNSYIKRFNVGEKIDFTGHEYWRLALNDLHDAYSSICAYTCHWIAPDTGSDTVEHFRPKSRYPNEAYEWKNYRLVCGRLNGRKGDNEDVIDPFKITKGMFEIDFPSLQIRPGKKLSAAKEAIAMSSIQRLKLNDERCIRARQSYAESFRDGHISFDYLKKQAPFLALELERQGVRDRLSEVLKPN